MQKCDKNSTIHNKNPEQVSYRRKIFPHNKTTINIMPQKGKLNSFSLSSEQDKTDDHHHLFNPLLRVLTRKVGQ